jgi:transketolase C-terminal domain/subunit
MPKAIRDVYGEVLVELGAENKNIVVQDGISPAPLGAEKFVGIYGPVLYMGIAESYMVSAASRSVHLGEVSLCKYLHRLLSTLGLIATARPDLLTAI